MREGQEWNKETRPFGCKGFEQTQMTPRSVPEKEKKKNTGFFKRPKSL